MDDLTSPLAAIVGHCATRGVFGVLEQRVECPRSSPFVIYHL